MWTMELTPDLSSMVNQYTDQLIQKDRLINTILGKILYAWWRNGEGCLDFALKIYFKMFNELNFNFELILRIAIINFQEIFVLIIKH